MGAGLGAGAAAGAAAVVVVVLGEVGEGEGVWVVREALSGEAGPAAAGATCFGPLSFSCCRSRSHSRWSGPSVAAPLLLVVLTQRPLALLSLRRHRWSSSPPPWP